MRIVILAKTKMKNGVCVGAMTGAGRPVRLLQQDGHHQDYDFPYDVGDVLSLDYEDPRYLVEPHLEDILVSNLVKVRSVSRIESLAEWVLNHPKVEVVEGSISDIFDRLLQWTSSGSGYISGSSGVPRHSTGFWMPDKNLKRRECDNGRIKYSYKDSLSVRLLPFVGFQKTPSTLPGGIVLRVSLARWWSHELGGEPRCYLQLSGWYH